MGKLLQKEFRLAMHPITPFMLLLSAMVLIPNYPYGVIFFYVSMALFFTCLSGRENNDIVYSLNLPIRKRDFVKARFLFAVIVQMAQLALMIVFVLLSKRLGAQPNLAGMDANLALFGVGFVMYGLFNLVFFTSYLKNVNKVGVAFVKACVVVFLLVALDPVSTYALPFVRDCLDTPDPAFLTEKLLFVIAGGAVYIALTFLAYRIGARDFERLDLN